MPTNELSECCTNVSGESGLMDDTFVTREGFMLD